MAKTPAAILKDSVIKESVTAVLKPAGFRKSSSWFHRRHGSVVQGLQLQGSAGSHFESYFYVNVILRFDQLCDHLGRDRSDEKPKLGGGTKFGLFARLENLVPDTPQHWVLTAPGMPADFGERRRPEDVPSDDVPTMLRLRIEHLLTGLEGIDALGSFIDHEFFARTDFAVKLLTPYILGDFERCITALDSATERMRLRDPGTPRADPLHWVDVLQLDDLRSHYGISE